MAALQYQKRFLTGKLFAKLFFGEKNIFKLPIWPRHLEQITLELYFGEDMKSHFQQTLDVRPDRGHKTSTGYMQTVACGLCNNKITTVQDRCT